MRIYRYNVYYGRSGSLDGLFAVDDDGEACLRALIESRRPVHFGEVLGKHSDVTVRLDEAHLSRVEATPEEAATVLRVLELPEPHPVVVISGHCPLMCDGTCEFDGDPAALLVWAKGGDPTDPEVAS